MNITKSSEMIEDTIILLILINSLTSKEDTITIEVQDIDKDSLIKGIIGEKGEMINNIGSIAKVRRTTLVQEIEEEGKKEEMKIVIRRENKKDKAVKKSKREVSQKVLLPPHPLQVPLHPLLSHLTLRLRVKESLRK